MARNDDIDIRDLVDDGYSYEDIRDILEDAGYDSDDINEAILDLGYDEADALLDAIRDQAFDFDFFEDNVHDWADFLDLSVHELYDLYYGYEDSD